MRGSLCRLCRRRALWRRARDATQGAIVPGRTGRPGHHRWDHGPLPRRPAGPRRCRRTEGSLVRVARTLTGGPSSLPRTARGGHALRRTTARADRSSPRAHLGRPAYAVGRRTRVTASEALWGSLGTGGSGTCAAARHPWRMAREPRSQSRCSCHCPLPASRQRRPPGRARIRSRGDGQRLATSGRAHRRRALLDRAPRARGALVHDDGSGTARTSAWTRSAGASAARSRAAATDRATDRLARVGGFRVTARFGWAVQGFAARLTSGQVAALRRDPAVARRRAGHRRWPSRRDAWPPGIRRVHAVERRDLGSSRHGHRRRRHRYRHRPGRWTDRSRRRAEHRGRHGLPPRRQWQHQRRSRPRHACGGHHRGA